LEFFGITFQADMLETRPRALKTHVLV